MKFLAIIAVLLAIAFCVSADDVAPEFVFLRGTFTATKDGDLSHLIGAVISATTGPLAQSCVLDIDLDTMTGAYFNPPPTMTVIDEAGTKAPLFPANTLKVDFAVYFKYDSAKCTLEVAKAMLDKVDEILKGSNIETKRKDIVIQELADKKYNIGSECTSDAQCVTNNCVEQTVVPTDDAQTVHLCSSVAKYATNSAITTGAGLFAVVVAAAAVFLM